MPLLIPLVMGGGGFVAGFFSASPVEKALKWGAVAGVAYLIYKKVK